MSQPPRESLRRKSAARMAAVQALYSHDMDERKPGADKLIKQLTQQWEDSIGVDAEWPMDDKPEQSMLRDVVSGTLEHLVSIDETLSSIIKENWKTERMDPVMIAILRCATYELAHKPDRKTPVIADEYVSIASGYFEGNELGFVHSALQQIATSVRNG